MDPKVFKFVSGNTPPLNTRVRSTLPFVPNGSDPKAWDPSLSEKKHRHHKKHHKRDIAERGMDEDVHGFVWEAIPPLNTRERSTLPFVPNGSAIGDWNENTFSQRDPQSDINERDMDYDVHGFANGQNVVSPLPEEHRPVLPFPSNGGSNA